MSHWRRKPVVVEAWQFLPAGQCEELPAWIDQRWFHEGHMLIPAPAGTLRAEPGDWIIRSVKGDVYPCRADVFAATYESATQRGITMSKGMDRKKETKKKPAKSFDEKRAAKREKREAARR
jgi:hypothetical protein